MAGAITDISNVSITLQGVTVSRQGYGTGVFLSKHRFTQEVVNTYNDLAQVGKAFPTSHNVYKAAQSYFSNSPTPRSFKVGRINADLKLTPDAVVVGKVYSLKISSGTLSANISVTASSGDTAATVATAVAAAIEASSVGGKVTATAAAGVVTVVPQAPTDTFAVEALSNLADTYVSSVTAPQALEAVLDVDSDCYFIMSEDHSEAWVLALAANVEARQKLYAVSVSGANNYGAYTKGQAITGDVLGKLADQGYFRTFGLYSQTADTAFPEATYVGYNAPYDAGSVLWTNNKIALPLGLNAQGVTLTATQQNNLSARNATFIRNEGGNNATRGGLVAGGERIENIRGRDALQDEMKANLTALLLNQQGGKLPYNNEGINQVRAVMNKSLDVFVARNFINDNYVVSLPDERDVQPSKKAIGLFDQGRFRAELSGGIELIDIQGTLAVSFNA